MTDLPDKVERWRPLVQFFFRPEHWDYAVRMIFWESSGNEDALHPRSKASGLFQHLERFWPERIAKVKRHYAKAGVEIADDIFDPRANIAAAAWLLDHSGRDPQWGGWGQWTPSHTNRPEDFGTPRFGEPGVPFPPGGYATRGNGSRPGEEPTGSVSQPREDAMDRHTWKVVQRALQSLDPPLYAGKPVDGLPGKNTHASVRAFEKRMGLRQRGVLGELAEPDAGIWPATRELLLARYAATQD